MYLAAKQQQSGAYMDEVADYVRETIPHLCHWFTVNDLMFLKRGGRVDAATALCAERMAEPVRAPIVLLSSGENVVTVGAESGVGGRNQEYCTAAALTIVGSRKIVFGAVDTDGTDGPGGFRYPGAPDCLAGAITDGETAQAAKQAGIDLEDALRTHGTSEPLWRLGCGVAAAANVFVFVFFLR